MMTSFLRCVLHGSGRVRNAASAWAAATTPSSPAERILLSAAPSRAVLAPPLSRAALSTSAHPESASPTNAQVRARRSRLFEEEQRRQRDLVPRLEKIEVLYRGVGHPNDRLADDGSPPDQAETRLLLNKHLSTPHHVAQHISEMLVTRSALALVNGEQLWDMHRPLVEDCTVELLHFHQDDPSAVNQAFWRSCSFLLGAAAETVFREDLFVELHSFPPPNVSSGSFVCDVDLKLSAAGEPWRPQKRELQVFSAQMHRLAERALPFERLEVDEDVARDMFRDNQHKLKQVPSIAAKSDNKVTLYRVGDHVDISKGPMVGNSSFVGRRCSVMAAHLVQHAGQPFYRFQGVALPKNFMLNHFAWGLLEKRATRLNPANLEASLPATPS